MIIPTIHDFKCVLEPETGLTVSVISAECVQFTTENDAIVIADEQQIAMIRDMLTVWLSRPTHKDNSL